MVGVWEGSCFSPLLSIEHSLGVPENCSSYEARIRRAYGSEVTRLSGVLYILVLYQCL